MAFEPLLQEMQLKNFSERLSEALTLKFWNKKYMLGKLAEMEWNWFMSMVALSHNQQIQFPTLWTYCQHGEINHISNQMFPKLWHGEVWKEDSQEVILCY